jgi:hypothetical protein
VLRIKPAEIQSALLKRQIIGLEAGATRVHIGRINPARKKAAAWQ